MHSSYNTFILDADALPSSGQQSSWETNLIHYVDCISNAVASFDQSDDPSLSPRQPSGVTLSKYWSKKVILSAEPRRVETSSHNQHRSAMVSSITLPAGSMLSPHQPICSACGACDQNDETIPAVTRSERQSITSSTATVANDEFLADAASAPPQDFCSDTGPLWVEPSPHPSLATPRTDRAISSRSLDPDSTALRSSAPPTVGSYCAPCLRCSWWRGVQVIDTTTPVVAPSPSASAAATTPELMQAQADYPAVASASVGSLARGRRRRRFAAAVSTGSISCAAYLPNRSTDSPTTPVPGARLSTPPYGLARSTCISDDATTPLGVSALPAMSRQLGAMLPMSSFGNHTVADIPSGIFHSFGSAPPVVAPAPLTAAPVNQGESAGLALHKSFAAATGTGAAPATTSFCLAGSTDAAPRLPRGGRRRGRTSHRPDATAPPRSPATLAAAGGPANPDRAGSPGMSQAPAAASSSKFQRLSGVVREGVARHAAALHRARHPLARTISGSAPVCLPEVRESVPIPYFSLPQRVRATLDVAYDSPSRDLADVPIPDDYEDALSNVFDDVESVSIPRQGSNHTHTAADDLTDEDDPPPQSAVLISTGSDGAFVWAGIPPAPPTSAPLGHPSTSLDWEGFYADAALVAQVPVSPLVTSSPIPNTDVACDRLLDDRFLSPMDTNPGEVHATGPHHAAGLINSSHMDPSAPSGAMDSAGPALANLAAAVDGPDAPSAEMADPSARPAPVSVNICVVSSSARAAGASLAAVEAARAATPGTAHISVTCVFLPDGTSAAAAVRGQRAAACEAELRSAGVEAARVCEMVSLPPALLRSHVSPRSALRNLSTGTVLTSRPTSTARTVTPSPSADVASLASLSAPAVLPGPDTYGGRSYFRLGHGKDLHHINVVRHWRRDDAASPSPAPTGSECVSDASTMGATALRLSAAKSIAPPASTNVQEEPQAMRLHALPSDSIDEEPMGASMTDAARAMAATSLRSLGSAAVRSASQSASSPQCAAARDNLTTTAAATNHFASSTPTLYDIWKAAREGPTAVQSEDDARCDDDESSLEGWPASDLDDDSDVVLDDPDTSGPAGRVVDAPRIHERSIDAPYSKRRRINVGPRDAGADVGDMIGYGRGIMVGTMSDPVADRALSRAHHNRGGFAGGAGAGADLSECSAGIHAPTATSRVVGGGYGELPMQRTPWASSVGRDGPTGAGAGPPGGHGAGQRDDTAGMWGMRYHHAGDTTQCLNAAQPPPTESGDVARTAALALASAAAIMRTFGLPDM